MNYQETLTYLYTSAPLFQHVGKDAYKEGLDTTHKLDSYFGATKIRWILQNVPLARHAVRLGRGECAGFQDFDGDEGRHARLQRLGVQPG